MRKIFCVILFVYSIQIYNVHGAIDPSLLCTSEFCEETDEECLETSDYCEMHNETHSGTLMQSPTLCNCCSYCIEHLLEGDICTKGSLGSPPSGDMCGSGLYCTLEDEEEDATCERMVSECHTAQDEYDKRREEGTLGFLEHRPICDGDGDYGPVKCIPGQTCYCQSKSGNRIYGEVVNEKSIDQTMNCECARRTDTMKNLLDKSEYGSVRCLSDGSFDRLQCVEKRCFCVFNDTGLLSSSVIIDTDTQLLTSLPCYNKEHNPDPTQFFKPCEKKRNEYLNIISLYEMEGFAYLGDPLPECEADGNYYKIQKQEEKQICVTPEGDQIEEFEGELNEDMDCNCARTWLLLNSTQGTHKLPDCCKNGNWDKVQCRKNFCYCVDRNGNQNGIEVVIDDIKMLPCYNKRC